MKTTPASEPSPSSLLQPLPWLPAAAVSFLDDKLAGLSVFEWGSGGSTLWFAERARSVVSVEHDPVWFAQGLAHLPENAHIHLVPLGESYWFGPYGKFDFVL